MIETPAATMMQNTRAFSPTRQGVTMNTGVSWFNLVWSSACVERHSGQIVANFQKGTANSFRQDVHLAM